MSSMNNSVVAFNPTQLPAHLRTTELSAATKALMGNSSGYRLSIKGGVWRFLSNGKEYGKVEERSLDVVVVAAAEHVARTFYMATYDDDAPATAPDCSSRDGETPDPKSPHMQAKSCAECPQNAKGSGQGDSRACRFSQSLAVVLANDMGGNVLKLQVPAASIFGKGEGANVPLREYVTQLATVPVNIDTVVTRMKFDLESSSPKLFFAPVRYLTAEEYTLAQKQGQSPMAKQAVTFSVAQTDGVKAAPKIDGEPPVKAAPAAPVPPPPPPETDEEREAREFKEWKAAQAAKGKGKGKAAATKPADAPVAEPSVRESSPPTPSPGRKNLSALLDQWDGPADGKTDD